MRKEIIILAAIGAIVPSFALRGADYPDSDIFIGKYEFSANRELLDDSYEDTLPIQFTFELSGTGDTLSLNEFLGSSQGLGATYNQETGEIKFTGNTLRYGIVSMYSYLGLTNETGEWKGLGAINTTFPDWQVNENGSISVPDFCVVDYSTYNKVEGTPATIVAKYSDIELELQTEQSGEQDWSAFSGKYQFMATRTDFPIEGYSQEEGVFEDSTLTFTINTYGQISAFNDFTEILSDGREGDFLFNRGRVSGDDFTIYMGPYSYADQIRNVFSDGSTSLNVMLFGGAANDVWAQDKVAFTLTKNDDGTFSLTPVSIWYQYSVEETNNEGQKVTVRHVELLTAWSDIQFVEFIPDSTSAVDTFETTDSSISACYYNLQGVKVDKPEKGFYIKVEGNKISKCFIR